MRIRPIRGTDFARASRKASRRVLTASAVATMATGAVLFGTGTASATTLQADTCTSDVTGRSGDQVTVNAASLKSLVEQGAQSAKQIAVVDDLAIWPSALADEVAKQGTLQVATVQESEHGTVSGDAVGDAVVRTLQDKPGLPLIPERKQQALEEIKSTVAGSCGLHTTAADQTAPTTPPTSPNIPAPQPGGDDGSTPLPAPSGAAQPGVGLSAPIPLTTPATSTGYAARRDYSGIPVAAPGMAPPPGVRYPASGPLPDAPQGPQLGILGGGDTQPRDNANVRNAGNADALASGQQQDTVQLPMLFAVVALAGATAALVRTWVLRKVS